jgi:hypothetical protein
MILGTISAVDNDNGLQLIIDGEDEPTTKKYTYMASYVPAANDRVILEDIGGSYVIMGKVISDITESGIVRSAENATNAQTAAECTGNAATATTAASCSGNAATATTAAACSGNAATATALQNPQYTYGGVVTYVTRSYNSQLGTYIVTDITLSNGNYIRTY